MVGSGNLQPFRYGLESSGFVRKLVKLNETDLYPEVFYQMTGLTVSSPFITEFTEGVAKQIFYGAPLIMEVRGSEQTSPVLNKFLDGAKDAPSLFFD